MISSREKERIAKSKGQRWHYLAVKKLLALLRGTNSKHNGDFYCLNCFHSFTTVNKLESLKKACENKDFCSVNMPSGDNKIIEFNQCQKSDKAPFIIYDGCKNDPENLSSTKVSKQVFQCLQYFRLEA